MTPPATTRTSQEVIALSARLARHYLTCVETEDRRSLQLRARDRDGRFIAPWRGQEPLLHPGADTCLLEPTTDSERAYLARGAADVSGPDIGFYGYPLLHDGDGRLAPLFVLPVRVEDLGTRGTAPAYRVHRTDRILLNRYLFRDYTDDELDAIQAELEKDGFATFTARLQAALGHLDGTLGTLAQRDVEPFPTGAGARWVRCPVYFRDSRGPFTFNVRQDLSALDRYASVQADVPRTALGVLLGAPAQQGPEREPAEVRPLNPSQERAARSALREPLTVVTGPPGTGKSQVVVDLLATAILDERPVLFASKNNQAVDVVRQRLREALGEPYDFTVRVGNREMMDAFGPELLSRLARLREEGPPGGEEEAGADVERVRGELAELRRRVGAAETAAAAEASAAEGVPASWRAATPEQVRPALDARTLRDLLEEARAYGGETPLGVVRWVRRLFRGSAIRRTLLAQFDEAFASAPDIVRDEAALDMLREDGYPPLIRALRHAIAYHQWLRTRSARLAAEEALAAALRRSDTPDGEERALKEELAEATTRLCRAAWGRRLHDHADEVRRALEQYQDALRAVGGRGADFARSLDGLAAAQERLARWLPVWITTVLAARNALPLRPALFDLVVLDEASQCDIASALPVLYRARRAAVIGDPHQLRHIAAIEKEDEEALPTAQGLLPRWSYVTHSLFDTAARTNAEAGRGEPLFLEEHYRSHPSIIGFSNGQFYGGRLRVLTDLAALQARLSGVQMGISWYDVRGQVPPSSRSAYNDQEIAAVMEHIGALLDALEEGVSIGIVTPFRAQSDRLKRRVHGAPWYERHRHRVSAGTAYAFQGDERDIIVFSPVVSEGMRPGTRRWAATTEALLNVAVTRARAALHVIGDANACRAAGGPLRELVRHAEVAR